MVAGRTAAEYSSIPLNVFLPSQARDSQCTPCEPRDNYIRVGLREMYEPLFFEAIGSCRGGQALTLALDLVSPLPTPPVLVLLVLLSGPSTAYEQHAGRGRSRAGGSREQAAESGGLL